MPGFLVALAVVTSLALPAPASSAPVARSGAELAAVLVKDPVYADPRARPTLTAAQAERLRLRIAQRAPGRLAIALVPDGVAGAAGGVKGLAHAIDRDFDVKGALLVLDSKSAWVVVSYSDTAPAIRAVQGAFAGRGRLAQHLTVAVDRLAAADPGAATTPSVVHDTKKDVGTIFLVVALLVGAPLVLLGPFLVVRAGRRARARRGRDPSGLQVAPPRAAPPDSDAQRQAAEQAFGRDD